MNLNRENGGEIYNHTIFEPLNGFMSKSLSKPEILKVYDTYQFKNYDLYEMKYF